MARERTQGIILQGNTGTQRLPGHLAIHLTQQCCIFQPVRQSTARDYTKAVIPVSPQGKTGISLTQARVRKDEIPAGAAPGRNDRCRYPAHTQLAIKVDNQMCNGRSQKPGSKRACFLQLNPLERPGQAEKISALNANEGIISLVGFTGWQDILVRGQNEVGDAGRRQPAAGMPEK